MQTATINTMNQTSLPEKYIEYITIIEGNSFKMIAGNDESGSNEQFISQLSFGAESDDDSKPSLTLTYDLDDDSDSFDLIDSMISNDELSIEYENSAICNSRTNDLGDDSDSFDLIDSMISNDELSIEYENSAICNSRTNDLNDSDNFGLIDSLTSNDELSIQYKSGAIRLSPSVHDRDASIDHMVLEQSPGTIEKKFIERKRNQLSTKQIPHEVIHQEYQQLTSEEIAHCNNHKSSCLERSVVELERSVVEAAGEIVCVCIIVAFYYLIFMLYSDAISTIMQGDNIVFMSLV